MGQTSWGSCEEADSNEDLGNRNVINAYLKNSREQIVRNDPANVSNGKVGH